MDFTGVFEEIALEGLDGITIEALWKRLEERPDFVEGVIDQHSKCYIWRLIADHEEVQFYELPEARPELVIFRYNDYVKSGDIKCVLPPKVPEDIYSRTIVSVGGITGCCDHFHTRTEITEEIRSSSQKQAVSLEEAISRWGQKLVMVASQRKRNLLLLQTNHLSVTVEQYVFLEIIGRARYDGEVTFFRYRRGLCNPHSKQFSLTSAAYARIFALEKTGLVTKQVFIMTYSEPHWVNQVRLVHLKRFHCITNGNYRGVIKLVANHLFKFPNMTAPYFNLLADLNIHVDVFRRVNKRVKSYFSVRNVKRQHYFEGDVDLQRRTEENEMRLIGRLEERLKVITLVKVYHDSDTLGDEDEDPDDEKCEDEMEESMLKEEGGTVAKTGCVYPSIDQSIMGQIVEMIYSTKEKGILSSTVQRRLNLSRTNMKRIDKELLRTKTIGTVQKSQGRMRVMIWMRPDLAERQIDSQMGHKSNQFYNKSECVTDTSVVTDDPISAEEEAAMDEQLKILPVKCTVDRVETKKISTAQEDPRKTWRKRFILDALGFKKCLSSSAQLYRDMASYEKGKGMKEKVCRKSVKRILTLLYEEGLIEYLNVEVQTKPDVVETQAMIILPGADLSNPHTKKAVVEFTIARLKLKENESKSKAKGNKSKVPSQQDENFGRYSIVADLGLVSVYKMLSDKVNAAAKKSIHILKASWHVSKMERAESLHQYMFYLLYDYQGATEPIAYDVLDEVEDPVPVYFDVDDWRRYQPPIKLHNPSALKKIKAGKGACLMGDLLYNMPLSKIWNLLNRAPELHEIIKDWVDNPRLNKVPLSRIPAHIMVELIVRKRFLVRIQEDLNLMCQLGLLSFGPKQSCNIVEFTSIYLHKHGMLLDTRCSEVCYLLTKCPEGQSFSALKYHFQTPDDLEQYWLDMQTISLSTLLGCKKKANIDVPGSYGEVSLATVSKPKPFEEIYQIDETNWLPGDRRGAAGIDSYLMAHSTRNWKTVISRLVPSKKLGQIRLEKKSLAEKSKAVKKSPDAAPKDEPPAKKRKVAKKKVVINETQPAPAKKPGRRRCFTRKPSSKPKKPWKPKKKYSEMFDDKDRAAKRALSRIRTVFTPLMNGQLLLCQLAANIINPKMYIVRSSVIRDMLQELYPEARDKTTAAIKGKIARLNNDPNFIMHLAIYMAQVRSDKELMAKYTIKPLPKHLSPRMEVLFRQLYAELRAKFSSPGKALLLPLPSSIAELHSEFRVQQTFNQIDQTPKLSKPAESLSEIRSMVVANLLQTLLHSETGLSSVIIYNILSKFTDMNLEEAYNLLITYNIMVKLKRADKEKKTVLTNTAVLNNYKCKFLHCEHLKSLMPKNLFTNVIRVLRLMNGGVEKAAVQSMNKEPHLDSMDTLSPPKEKETKDKTSVSQSNYTPIPVREFQGGAALTVACLSTLDRLSMQMHIPKEVVSLDRMGQRKVGIRLNSEKPFSRTGKKGVRILKRPRDDDEEDEQNSDGARESTDSPFVPGIHRIVNENYPTTQNAKISLEQEQRAMMRMKPNTESSTNISSPSTSSSAYAISKSLDSASMDIDMPIDAPINIKSSTQMGIVAEQPVLADGNSAEITVHSNDSRMRHGARFLKKHENSNGGVEDDIMQQKTISLNNIEIMYDTRMSSQGEVSTSHAKAGQILPKYVAWVASSCLMTLARTSYIDSMNLLTADCTLNRHFSLVPFDTKFKLKQPLQMLEKTLQSEEGSSSNTNNSSQSQVTKGASLPKTVNTDSEEQQQQEQSEMNQFPCYKYLEDSHYLKLYTDIIKELEMDYLSEDLDNHVEDADFENLLPDEVRDEGRRLFYEVDQAGELGIDERDLQKKMCMPATKLRQIVNKLHTGKVILKTGFYWRRLVSRQFARPWLVEVTHLVDTNDEPQQQEMDTDNPDNPQSVESPVPTISKFYVTRPWRYFENGGINMKGLIVILERVLTDLMVRPGRQVNDLCHEMNPNIIPAVVLDALEILERLGCIKLVHVKTTRKISLFGPASRHDISYPSKDAIMDSTWCIDLTVESPLIYSAFIHTAQEYFELEKR